MNNTIKNASKEFFMGKLIENQSTLFATKDIRNCDLMEQLQTLKEIIDEDFDGAIKMNNKYSVVVRATVNDLVFNDGRKINFTNGKNAFYLYKNYAIHIAENQAKKMMNIYHLQEKTKEQKEN